MYRRTMDSKSPLTGEELRPRLKAYERNKRNNPHANLA